jgi:hypothetical protein
MIQLNWRQIVGISVERAVPGRFKTRDTTLGAGLGLRSAAVSHNAKNGQVPGDKM